MKINLAKFAASIVICFLAAAFGSVFTYPSITTWYTSLNKPFFTPPNWLFGPAWTVLYTLMAISLYLVWMKGLENKEVKQAIYIFGIQLFLNALWSLLFFGLQSPFYGFLGIVPLWIAILLTIWKFWRIDRNAGLLLVPYILWVSFAATLNLSVWLLNP
jgi:tryptophan-rich sensory protein